MDIDGHRSLSPLTNCIQFNAPVAIYLVAVALILLSLTEAEDQRLFVDKMQNVDIDCAVKNVQFEVVTLKWSKRQIDNSESMLLFVGDKPLRPQTGDFARYNTSHTVQVNGFLYTLNIYNTQPQDSGLYSCEVLDAKGNTAFRMNSTLNVIDPVESLTLFKNYSYINSTTNTSTSPFYYSVGYPGSVGCRVIGGNPQPNVTMTLASKVLTSQKFLLVEKFWIGSEEGFQKPSWTVVLYFDQITIRPEYDGTTVVCFSLERLSV